MIDILFWIVAYTLLLPALFVFLFCSLIGIRSRGYQPKETPKGPPPQKEVLHFGKNATNSRQIKDDTSDSVERRSSI